MFVLTTFDTSSYINGFCGFFLWVYVLLSVLLFEQSFLETFYCCRSLTRALKIYSWKTRRMKIIMNDRWWHTFFPPRPFIHFSITQCGCLPVIYIFSYVGLWINQTYTRMHQTFKKKIIVLKYFQRWWSLCG